MSNPIERLCRCADEVRCEMKAEIERLRTALERIVAIDDNYHSSLAIHKALEIASEALKDD